jgi:hypothetical protein
VLWVVIDIAHPDTADSAATSDPAPVTVLKG